VKVAVTGASGLIGSSLVPFLAGRGHPVLRLVRRTPATADEARWDPDGGTVDRAALDGLDAVVHLAGENLASGRWTEERKRRLYSSRVGPTRLLAQTLATLPRRPMVLVSASAMGYYGDRGDELLSEASPPGRGFLPQLCVDWENATQPAAAAGIRVVTTRTGLVLTPRGGVLGRMLPPFKAGIGGVLGSGRQYMSWIAIDDLLSALEHALTQPALSGPVNAVGPSPVTNREFTQALARVLGRPAIAPAPAFALRLMFGEMADAALLASTRVLPQRLVASGYRFRFPELEPALRHALGRRP
jgi:uncharacterized protein (TIGR01777 family)